MLASFSTTVGQKDPNEVISFYKVPLVCGAAPDLGCGSRAKPALLAMEKIRTSLKPGSTIQEPSTQLYGRKRI
jgi:hypothetical protein